MGISDQYRKLEEAVRARKIYPSNYRRKEEEVRDEFRAAKQEKEVT